MLKNNFFFKNINISYKKIFSYSKIFSNKPLLFFYYINLENKFNNFIKNIINVIFNFYKNINVFIKNFYVSKSFLIKKLNFRAKGRINFLKKNFSNIIIISYGKKN